MTTTRIRLLLISACLAAPLFPIQAQAPAAASAPAAPFYVSKVSHVMLGVADVHAAVAFYEGKLGLHAQIASDDLAFIDAGTISLVLSSEVGKRPGDSEIVFAVDHVQSGFDALRSAGIVFDHEPHLVSGTSWAANFHDPDGHILSLFGPK